MMRIFNLFHVPQAMGVLAFLFALPLTQAQSPGKQFTGVAGNTTIAGNPLGPDSNGKYTIYGTNIRATFIPYGASVSNLFINDTSGIERDLVGGWDNASYYAIDKQHPHFGGVPGRYANRIKNSSFVLDGETYQILPNENPTAANPAGIDTLHGGPNGWDVSSSPIQFDAHTCHNFATYTFSSRTKLIMYSGATSQL